MPDNANEIKASKLAAARKKLKDFQLQRHNQCGTPDIKAVTMDENISGTNNSYSIGSNLSHLCGTDLNISNINDSHIKQPQISNGSKMVQSHQSSFTSNDKILNDTNPENISESDLFTQGLTESEISILSSTKNSYQVTNTDLNAIQVLITEKAQLNSEVIKLRGLCREHCLETEELQVKCYNLQKNYDEVQARSIDQTRSEEELRKINAELQHNLAQSRGKVDDLEIHVAELQQQLTLEQKSLDEIRRELTYKSNALEMSNLKLKRLDDDTDVSNDSRIEMLTQTQYMYEQQIRDLQAMLQQTIHDKEQTNIQYQNYVQNLTGELNKINELNSELTKEIKVLRERELQLVTHVKGLEQEIQKNLTLQQQYKDHQLENTADTEGTTENVKQLNKRLSDYEFERHELQLKIKSQDDKIIKTEQTLQEKIKELQTAKSQVNYLQTEQPDHNKLLATMESDKIAASRALSQNIELKKQLDEFEQRFVQLTNDKAELVNKLDAEEYAHREVQLKFIQIEQQLRDFDERFKFKDTEMIRLSHENIQLESKNLELQQQLLRLQKIHNCNKISDGPLLDLDSCIDQSRNHYILSKSVDEKLHLEDCPLDLGDVVVNQNSELRDYLQDHNVDSIKQLNQHYQSTHHTIVGAENTEIATEDAVKKLQQRFTQLISQVADLTEEKQRLEHLVMQLQSETETIGEYISLYQTQRRMLKQREYEKAAQMELLQTEREQLRDKISLLNELVDSLCVGVPPIEDKKLNNRQVRNDRATQKNKLSSVIPVLPKNSLEWQQIIKKIQNLITEIRANTDYIPTIQNRVDNFSCCHGKFEVV